MSPHSTPSASLQPRSIFCVGKNYPDHAREMASWEPEKAAGAKELHPEEPVIFMKPGSALTLAGRTSIPLFDGRPIGGALHYEAELVLLVGRDAVETPLDEAHTYITGYAAGLDMTLRDVQLEAKKAGNPWLKSKGFRQSALISGFIEPASSGPWEELVISLRLDGRLVQHSPVSKMSFSPAYLVHYLSYIYGLCAGDLIFTGTPAGVGPVTAGNHLEASLETGGIGGSERRTLASLKATVF